MAEQPGNGSQDPVPPSVFALATPKRPRSYAELSHDEAMAEIRGLLAKLRSAFREVATKVDAQERSASETRETLRQLAPRIKDIASFIKHRAPALADKADLVGLTAELRAEIEKRPT